MQYQELRKITEGKDLPMFGKTEDNEIVIIEGGASEGERFFRTTTVQHNDWCRVNIYWENGTIEETYKK